MENNTLKINITDIYTMLKLSLKAQGIETSCLEKKKHCIMMNLEIQSICW